ncbi:MAG: tetratricopeptide repeat-containing sensor histidine kinase [Pyrinomonadaceae bacterium]|nr:tetratricopeptide repeat-containing sensor histidine kinase [Sphingobacteriaceae bacterium]
MFLSIRVYIIFTAVLISNLAKGQQGEIDSLKGVLSLSVKADTNRVKIFNNLAYAYYKADSSDLVKKYSNKAVALSRKLKYRKGEAFAYRRLSTLYMLNNANPLALEYLNKAYKLYKADNDGLNCARVLTNIGLYYHEIKDYESALYYFSLALREAKRMNRLGLQVVLSNNIGDVFERKNLYTKAHENYNSALSLTLQSGDSTYLAFCYANLASIHYKEKHYTKALNYCEKALAATSGAANDLSEIYLIQARIYFALKNYVKARKVLKQSDFLTQQTHNLDVKLQIYHTFYVLDSAEHSLKSAMFNFLRYHKLHDSLVNVNKNRIVALYTIKFALQKREDENRLLRISEEKNQLIIRKQNTIQGGLLVGLLIIALGLIYLKHINNKVNAKRKIIEKQNKVLENSNLVKDKLFSVISHDLRSPIVHVISLFNLWESGAITRKEMATVAPIVKGYITNTLELLDNLLIWSKNQLQGFKFKPEFFNLYDLLIKTTQDLENLIQHKNLHIVNNIDTSSELYADREMIRIITRNLLSNAIKFTPLSGTISINNSIENEQIIISVQDTGIGIKESDLSKIFANNSHTTLGTANEKGTGMGLRICRDFIEINKGKIWVESVENEGSTFYISLPMVITLKQAI